MWWVLFPPRLGLACWARSQAAVNKWRACLGPTLGDRHPVPSLPLSLSGTLFLHQYSVGQGGHLVLSYAEKLSLLSLEGAAEQRPLLRGGAGYPHQC